MSLREIWSVVGAIIVSVGGAGAIICGVSSFLANRIADRLEIKYQQTLDKELEKYRSALEQKRYVTKTQFDREYEIYGQLSKAFFELQIKLSTITHEDCYIERKSKKETYEHDIYIFKELTTCAGKAQGVLFENAAFLPETIFSHYEKIYDLANDQFWIFRQRLDDYYNGKISMQERLTQADKDRYSSIAKEMRETNSALRTYLNTLSVIE